MKTDIITGQFVRIAQTPATVADRVLARVIDNILLIIYLIVVSVTISLLEDTFDLSDTDDLTAIILILLLYAIYLPVLFYTFICEAFFNGQTVGKRVMKTRVVNADGSQPGIGQLFLRWLLLIVDEGMGLIGIIFIMFNRNGQRLGDMAAGTFVIRLQGYRQLKVTLNDFQYASPDYSPVYPQAANLSIGQAEVIRKALHNTPLDSSHSSGTANLTNAREDVEAASSLNACERLAQKVEKALGIQRRESSPVNFLLNVLHDYQYYALELL